MADDQDDSLLPDLPQDESGTDPSNSAVPTQTPNPTATDPSDAGSAASTPATGESGGDLGAIDANPDDPAGPGETATDSGLTADELKLKDYQDAMVGVYQRTHAQNQAHFKAQEPLINQLLGDYQKLRAASNQTPVMTGKPVDVTPAGQDMLAKRYPGTVQSTQDQKNQVSNGIWGLLAASALAFGLYGSYRSNPRAVNGIYEGLGNAFRNYSEGQAGAAQQKIVGWQKLTEQIGAENNDRIKNYKAILGNKKMNLTEQMSVIKTLGGIYKDQQMEAAGANKNLASVVTQLQQKVKGQDRWNKATLQTVGGPKAEAQWRTHVLEKTGGKLDVQSSPEARQKAMTLFPPSKLMQESIQANAAARARGTVLGRQEGENMDSQKAKNPFQLDLPGKK